MYMWVHEGYQVPLIVGKAIKLTDFNDCTSICQRCSHLHVNVKQCKQQNRI